MEQNFQTSFIPKQPIVREHGTAPRPVGLLVILSIFILFTVVLSSGALYLYKGISTKSVAKKEVDLKKAEDRFEPSKIKELQVLDKRLNAANRILSKHVAISPIFRELQATTMKSVRFTKFSYAFGDQKDAKINVKMSGVTLGYRFLALQSDLFSQNKNFIDPVFSNLALSESGNVTFDLDFSVDPAFIDYKMMLKTEMP